MQAKTKGKKPTSIIYICVACLLAFLQFGSAYAAGDPGECLPEQFVLPNGLKVIILEEHSYPVVSCMSWYKVGSRNETAGKTGLSHLVEHLLFNDVGSFHDNEIGALIARAGGQFNGFTSDDFTTFFEVLPAQKLELALHVESERMKGAVFKLEQVQAEIARIQQEFENDAKDGPQLLAQEVRSLIFQVHPYHSPIMGWRTDVENLTPAHAQAFYDQYFRPNNATIVIVGAVKTQDALLLVKKYFGDIVKKSGDIPLVDISEPNHRGERRVSLKYPGIKQDLLEVAYHAPAMSDADAPAMIVIERLLNAAIAGRLKTRMVAQKVCSSAQSSYEVKKDPGLFAITCKVIPGVTEDQLLDVFDVMINQLRGQLVTEPELRRAKNLAEFGFVSEVDGPYRAGFHLGYFDALSQWQDAYTRTEKLKTVSAIDVQRAARRYLNPDNRIVGWLSSPNTSKPPATKPDINPSGGPNSGDRDKEQPKIPRSRRAMNIVKVNMIGYKDDDGGVPASGSNGAGATTSTALPKETQEHLQEHAKERLLDVRVRCAQERTLKNGMSVIVFESHFSPVVQVLGAIRAGNIYDPSGKKGISTVLAACLNNGSLKHAHSQLQSLQEDMGLPSSAMIKFDDDLETILFQTKCLSSDLQTQLTYLIETLSAPAFSETDCDKAKLDAITSIKKSDATLPARVDHAILRSLIAADSPYYPVDNARRVKEISSLKAADVKAFHAQCVAPNTTIIVLAGDTNIDQVCELLERISQNWSGRVNLQKLPVQATNKKILRTTIPKGDSAEGMISLGQLFHTQPNHQEYAQLLIADAALNDHPIMSRLGRRFESEPSVAETVGSEELHSKLKPIGNATVWDLSLSVESDAVSKAVQSLLVETRKFARSGLTLDELKEVRRYLVGAVPVRTMANLNAVANTCLQTEMQCGEPDVMSRLLNNVITAGLEPVNKMIRTVMKPDQASMIVSGRGETIKTIRKEVQQPSSSDKNYINAKPERAN